MAVTGATGFVGWRVAEMLRDRGARVRAVVRPGRRKPLPEGVEAADAVLSDAGTLTRAFSGVGAVVHVAGVIRARDQAGFDAVNVTGTRAVVDAANAVGARLVLISSLAASGPATRERPAREDDRPRPLNSYGRSKLAGEQEVRSAARVPWTIVRPPVVYGPRDRGVLPAFRLAARGVFVHATPRSMPFTFIYIDDLARGIVAAVDDERSVGQTLFLAHPQVFTADDLLRELAAVFGRTYRPLSMPRPVLAATAAVGDLCWRLGVKPLIDSGRLGEFRAEGFVCSVDRAREVLGFTAQVGLREGLQRTAAWYRRHGWL